MTPAAIAELVAAAPLPPGYSLQVTTQRKHPLRSLWNVRIFRGDERVWGRAAYNVAAVIVVAQATAWAMSRESVA